MVNFFATLNYDFLWGMCIGAAIVLVVGGWYLALNSSADAETSSASPDAPHLNLPGESPNDISPITAFPYQNEINSNLVMTLAPTLVPLRPATADKNEVSPTKKPQRSVKPKSKRKSVKPTRRTSPTRRKQSRARANN